MKNQTNPVLRTKTDLKKLARFKKLDAVVRSKKHLNMLRSKWGFMRRRASDIRKRRDALAHYLRQRTEEAQRFQHAFLVSGFSVAERFEAATCELGLSPVALLGKAVGKGRRRNRPAA